MIAYLKGNLLFRGINWGVLNVSGVGYKVMCPSRTLDVIAIGDEAEFFIHTAVRENDITLYGFADGNDMDVFHALTALQGIGPSMALSVLGIMGINEISTAINSSDVNALCRAPGIGKKIATRMVAELTGSILFKNEPVVIHKNVNVDAMNIAIQSLVRLGFRDIEARSMVQKVMAGSEVFTKAEDIVVRALKN